MPPRKESKEAKKDPSKEVNEDDDTKGKKTAKKKTSKLEAQEENNGAEGPVGSPKNFVYVYLQLQKIESLPRYCDGPEREFIIELSHIKENIQKLKEPFDINDTRLNLKEKCRCSLGDYKLTFTVRIEQDSFDEMNVYSDCPIIVTIYQWTPKHIKDMDGDYALDDLLGEMEFEPEFENARLEPIAMGYIDLFQYFSKKRALSNITHFVYPLKDRRLQAFKMSWHIYTLLPLLKENTFENVMFLEFETIYNAHKDLLDDCEDLVLDLSLRTTNPNEEGENLTYKICSYSGFYKEIITSQDDNYVWASMKEYEPVPGSRLCQQSGLSLNKYKPFANVLGTEFVDFDFDLIDIKEESALICNGVHRFVLNKQLAKLLDQAISCSYQELVLELYRLSLPEVKLLAGTVNLAILAYPSVSKIRFAVELNPVENDFFEQSKNVENDKSKSKVKGKDDTDKAKEKDKAKDKDKDKDKGKDKDRSKDDKSKSLFFGLSSKDFEEGEEEGIIRKVFATMTICMLYPIGEGNDQLVKYNETEGRQEILKTCREVIHEVPIDPRYCEESYRNFDHVILGIINDILTNDIMDIEKCPGFFCCHLANLTNRITKLVACDFNRRCPTSTTIEFTNLMTTVYKELECRMFCILNKCSANGLENCILNLEQDIARYINYFNLYKYANEAGDTQFADFMFQRVKEDCRFSYIINFYKFLYDIESQDFSAAEDYFELPITEQDIASIYFTDIIELYMNHKKNEMTEETAEVSFELLLESLLNFTTRYPKDIDVWILLYCYYHRHQYIPGMEYTRWKFENLYDEPQRVLAYIPVTLWNMYYEIEDDREFENIRNEYFFKTLKTFLKIGVYEFAEVLYEELSEEFSEFESYCIEYTFQIFEHADLLDSKISSFGAKGEDSEIMKATENHTNGNVKYYVESIDEALNLYGNIVNAPIESFEPYQLGLLRYGHENLKQGNYEAAAAAFDKVSFSDMNRLLAYLGKAKAMYSLGNYAKAEFWFAECTRFGIYMPDVWGWLALINLKTNQNFKALECWKHARLNPKTAIDEVILDELDKIDYMDVFLYVDLPKTDIDEKCERILKDVEMKHEIPVKTLAKATKIY